MDDSPDHRRAHEHRRLAMDEAFDRASRNVDPAPYDIPVPRAVARRLERDPQLFLALTERGIGGALRVRSRKQICSPLGIGRTLISNQRPSSGANNSKFAATRSSAARRSRSQALVIRAPGKASQKSAPTRSAPPSSAIASVEADDLEAGSTSSTQSVEPSSASSTGGRIRSSAPRAGPGAALARGATPGPARQAGSSPLPGRAAPVRLRCRSGSRPRPIDAEIDHHCRTMHLHGARAEIELLAPSPCWSCRRPGHAAPDFSPGHLAIRSAAASRRVAAVALPAAGERALDRGHEYLLVIGLLDVVDGAELECLHRGSDVAMPGQHDHRGRVLGSGSARALAGPTCRAS